MLRQKHYNDVTMNKFESTQGDAQIEASKPITLPQAYNRYTYPNKYIHTHINTHTHARTHTNTHYISVGREKKKSSLTCIRF